MGKTAPILVIDNYDSFVYNLVRYLRELQVPVLTYRHDAIDLEGIAKLNPAGILLSPGPKRPSDAGICACAVRSFAGRIPILGVCLGHQVIAEAFGGRVVQGVEPVHGKNTLVLHDGRGVFKSIPTPFSATRYHSLVVSEAELPDCLEVSARAPDGVILGIRHRALPVEGVQFHPEAERTEHGHLLLANFLRMCGYSDREGGWIPQATPISELTLTSWQTALGRKREYHPYSMPLGLLSGVHAGLSSAGLDKGIPLNLETRVLQLSRAVEAVDVFAATRHRTGTVFLDSAARHEKLGRYSIVAWSPWMMLTERAGGTLKTVWNARESGLEAMKCKDVERNEETTETLLPEDVLTVLQKVLQENRIAPHPDLPFIGGAIGLIGFEAEVEPDSRDGADDAQNPACQAQPSTWFWFHRHLIIADHLSGLCYLLLTGPKTVRDFSPGKESDHGLIHEPLSDMNPDECGESAFWRMIPERGSDFPAAGEGGSPVENRSRALSMPSGWQESFRSNFSEEAYCEAVSAMRDHIRRGDIYLANMTRQFQTETGLSGFVLHDLLRRLNPAPFSAWFPFDRFELISASPERFLQIRDGWVETRPIKGTRPRGLSPETDAANRKSLEESVKDQAELLMVTDLERNDLSRVCEPGTVSVMNLFEVEAHPTVFHLVATVRGRLETGLDAVDCMRACFPGGSITGTPKIQAIKVIRDLEQIPRGAYTGCLGYFGFDGGADFSIIIRTLVKQGRNVSFGVGGGITWDSVPVEEHWETLDKAKALMIVLSENLASN